MCVVCCSCTCCLLSFVAVVKMICFVAVANFLLSSCSRCVLQCHCLVGSWCCWSIESIVGDGVVVSIVDLLHELVDKV